MNTAVVTVCWAPTRLNKLVKLVEPSFSDSEPSITCVECGQSQGNSVQVPGHITATTAEAQWVPIAQTQTPFTAGPHIISIPRGRIPFIMSSSPAPPIAPWSLLSVPEGCGLTCGLLLHLRCPPRSLDFAPAATCQACFLCWGGGGCGGGFPNFCVADCSHWLTVSVLSPSV